MQHNSSKILTFALLLLLPLLTGCLNEDTQPQPEQGVKGRIVLSLVGMEGYVDAQTRATQTLTNYDGYTYTLTGTSLIDGHTFSPVNGNLGDLMDVASLELEAGIYRLTVSNESVTQTGVGFPTYSGYQDFTLHVDDVVNVSIYMGKPSNAKLTIVQDGTFSLKYGNAVFTIGGRTINLLPEVAGTIAYFPTGQNVSYTIAAAAKSGSHVTDISGVTGSITVEAGKAYTLTLNADPVTGILIPVVSGTHTGEFD